MFRVNERVVLRNLPNCNRKYEGSDAEIIEHLDNRPYVDWEGKYVNDMPTYVIRTTESPRTDWLKVAAVCVFEKPGETYAEDR
jgi:hypothetical protein